MRFTVSWNTRNFTEFEYQTSWQKRSPRTRNSQKNTSNPQLQKKTSLKLRKLEGLPYWFEYKCDYAHTHRKFLTSQYHEAKSTTLQSEASTILKQTRLVRIRSNVLNRVIVGSFKVIKVIFFLCFINLWKDF